MQNQEMNIETIKRLCPEYAELDLAPFLDYDALENVTDCVIGCQGLDNDAEAMAEFIDLYAKAQTAKALAEARQALEVYADPNNWMPYGSFPSAKWFRKPTGIEDGGLYARGDLQTQPTPGIGAAMLRVVDAAKEQLERCNEYKEEKSVSRYKQREDAYLKACLETNEAVKALNELENR